MKAKLDPDVFVRAAEMIAGKKIYTGDAIMRAFREMDIPPIWENLKLYFDDYYNSLNGAWYYLGHPGTPANQEARMLALLLCAEIVRDEQRNSRLIRKRGAK